MEIRSPGGLPNIVTLDNMRSTRWSRNPAIARVFTAFEWVRELNEGVNKIYADMEAAGFPEPVYTEPDQRTVLLTLYNDVAHRIPRLRGASESEGKPNVIAHASITLENLAGRFGRWSDWSEGGCRIAWHITTERFQEVTPSCGRGRSSMDWPEQQRPAAALRAQGLMVERGRRRSNVMLTSTVNY